MGRPRAFDWDEARQLRAAGLTYKQIGERLGVSAFSACLACNDQARANNRAWVRAWQRTGTCIDCGATINRQYEHCRECANKRQTSVREG